MTPMPEKVKELLLRLKQIYSGFGLDHLTHSLQTATRALREGGSDEMILLALCHDLGKAVSPANFKSVTAELLEPYLSDHALWIIRHQDTFHEHANHPAIENAKDLKEWNQISYDPRYKTLPLEFFEPLLNPFFGRKQGVFKSLSR